MSGPRILVIDDDEKITSSLRRALAYAGYGTVTARDGMEGLSMARESWPDLVILDILMPGIDGLEVCRRLREGGDVPIIMLTAKDDISDRVAGLDMGADDYLVKPFAVDELLARIRALLRRREPRDQEVLRFADLAVNTSMRQIRRRQRLIELSAKEYDLLLLFMRHPRQVLIRDTIFERVWGYDFSGESNVLDVYIGYLRNKLEAGGEKRLIHTVRGAGYVMRE